jgi:tetratricopeptide (TPR) repeat protein
MRAIDALFERAGEDVERRASVKFRLASFLAWGAGDLAEAEVMCWQARALFERAGDRRQALLVARELAWLRGLQGDFAGMAADAATVVRAADATGDRFVAMQGLHALGYAAVFRGRFAEAEPAIRRAVALAAEDGKSYRLTTAMGMFAVMHSAVGRASEALAVLDEAKSGNPDYRDTILVEQEVQTRWWAGNYRAAVAGTLEVIARSPQSTSRRRVVGLLCGALCAVETGEAREAQRFLTRAHASLGGRDWSVFNQTPNTPRRCWTGSKAHPTSADGGCGPSRTSSSRWTPRSGVARCSPIWPRSRSRPIRRRSRYGRRRS